MLLVKYILQLTVSTMPSHVQNEIKRKKYDQERKRYLTLRAKKDRRSGSVGVANINRKDSEDDGGDGAKINTSNTLQASPCPPIRESSAESNSQSSQECSAEEDSVELVRNKEAEVPPEKPKPATGGVVNVRATIRHSPLQAKNDVRPPHLSGSRQNLSSRIGKALAGGLTPNTYTTAFEENNHPNSTEAGRNNKVSTRQLHSSYTSPLMASTLGRSGAAASSNVRRQYGAADQPPSSGVTRHGYGPRNAEVGRNREQPFQQEEDIISPSNSSLSTVPGLPTPVQLNLDSESDDDTLYTVEDGFTPPAAPAPGFYQGATAPPLSPSSSAPSKPHFGYGSARRASSTSGSAYYSKEWTADADDDELDGPKAKWGVGHILAYARSERSLSLSEQRKKSR